MSRQIHLANVPIVFSRLRGTLRSTPPPAGDPLALSHQSLEFLADPRFSKARAAAMASGHSWGEGHGLDWRIATCCWAGAHASRLAGDFVECGVHTGMFSLAVCTYTAFEQTDKRFWLFDTFSGVPEEQFLPAERARSDDYAAVYAVDTFEVARENFAAFPNVELVRGTVPASLGSVEIDQVAYLSIDMNIAFPELAALEHFWPKLVPGGVVVFDDYGWKRHAEQKRALDRAARERGVEIFSLPTGQGLLLKS
jgi:hypothetical protein